MPIRFTDQSRLLGQPISAFPALRPHSVQLDGLALPASHTINHPVIKERGDVLDVRWPVTNSGNLPGQVWIRLSITNQFGNAATWDSPSFAIDPGEQEAAWNNLATETLVFDAALYSYNLSNPWPGDAGFVRTGHWADAGAVPLYRYSQNTITMYEGAVGDTSSELGSHTFSMEFPPPDPLFDNNAPIWDPAGPFLPNNAGPECGTMVDNRYFWDEADPGIGDARWECLIRYESRGFDQRKIEPLIEDCTPQDLPNEAVIAPETEPEYWNINYSMPVGNSPSNPASFSPSGMNAHHPNHSIETRWTMANYGLQGDTLQLRVEAQIIGSQFPDDVGFVETFKSVVSIAGSTVSNITVDTIPVSIVPPHVGENIPPAFWRDGDTVNLRVFLEFWDSQAPNNSGPLIAVHERDLLIQYFTHLDQAISYSKQFLSNSGYTFTPGPDFSTGGGALTYGGQPPLMPSATWSQINTNPPNDNLFHYVELRATPPGGSIETAVSLVYSTSLEQIGSTNPLPLHWQSAFLLNNWFSSIPWEVGGP